MGLKSDYIRFHEFNDRILEDLSEFIKQIKDLDIKESEKKDILNELEQLKNSFFNVKMSVQNPDRRPLNFSKVFYDYKIILSTIEDERRVKKDFAGFNKSLEKVQVEKMEKFFRDELNYDGDDLEELAVKTLKGETEKSDYHINLARKKGRLSRNSEYNAFTAEKKFLDIARFEEEKALEFAEKLKKKGFEYGDKKLENRPKIFITEEALEKANKATRKGVVSGDPNETGGVFKSRRLGNGKILLEDFENWDTYDKKTSTGMTDEQVEEFWGESGRELINWHCHPKPSDIDRPGSNYADRLSDDDVDMMRDTVNKGNHFGYQYGEKVGIREGIAILSTAWDHRPKPEEDIVWLACAVSSQGGASGFFNLHIVNESSDGNLDITDGKYSWPKIYNKWIKAAMAGSKNIGPYSEYLEVNKLENKLK
jgi:hypothetical protein